MFIQQNTRTCTIHLLTLSVSDRKLSPDCSTTAFGVSCALALANTPTVGRSESTIPIAS